MTPGSSRFPSLSVFFPAYNDAPSLPGLIERTFKVLNACASDYEVIVVNDGSRDGTAVVLANLEAKYHNRLRVVTHEKNQSRSSGLAKKSQNLLPFAAWNRDPVSGR